MAHEVGHLKHGDTGRAAQAAAMLSGLSAAKRAGDRMVANKRKEKSDASVAAALAAAGAASSAAGLLLRLAGTSAQNHAGRGDGVEVGASPKTKKSQRRREAGATSSPRTPSPRSSSTPARWRARSRRSRPRARRGTSCTRGPAPTRTRTLATTTGRRAGSGRTRPSRRGSPRSNRVRRPDARRRRPGRGSPPKRSRSRSRKFPYFSSVHPICGWHGTAATPPTRSTNKSKTYLLRPIRGCHGDAIVRMSSFRRSSMSPRTRPCCSLSAMVLTSGPPTRSDSSVMSSFLSFSLRLRVSRALR